MSHSVKFSTLLTSQQYEISVIKGTKSFQDQKYLGEEE